MFGHGIMVKSVDFFTIIGIILYVRIFLMITQVRKNKWIKRFSNEKN